MDSHSFYVGTPCTPSCTPFDSSASGTKLPPLTVQANGQFPGRTEAA
jgi:hypothetical protein